MKSTRHILSMICFAAIALPAAPALAEKAVMPPPEERAPAADTPDQMQERAPDLREELKTPEGGYSIDVRSYQRRDGATITEYSVQGRVYKIKVQPAGGLPAYYLYDREGNGNFEQRLPGGAKRLVPPTWVLKEF
ncbi:MAG: DUF2782 domain-containing protein [Elusimicrobiales bacterium]|nr:DUF2782 domain-containing protein [Elusimicrobiales bacterium]